MKIIGIDPAFRVSGFGICELGERSVCFPKIQTFIDFFAYANTFNKSTAQIFVVENSNLQNTTFSTYKANANQLQRISRNVGANQAVSQMVVDYLRYIGLEVVEVSPLQKGSKLNQKAIEYLAKSEGIELPARMSQDDRDAFKLAYQQKRRLKAEKNNK